MADDLRALLRAPEPEGPSREFVDALEAEVRRAREAALDTATTTPSITAIEGEIPMPELTDGTRPSRWPVIGAVAAAAILLVVLAVFLFDDDEAAEVDTFDAPETDEPAADEPDEAGPEPGERGDDEGTESPPASELRLAPESVPAAIGPVEVSVEGSADGTGQGQVLVCGGWEGRLGPELKLLQDCNIIDPDAARAEGSLVGFELGGDFSVVLTVMIDQDVIDDGGVAIVMWDGVGTWEAAAVLDVGTSG